MGPCTPGRPADRHVRSGVGRLSRRCRAGRGRRAPTAGPSSRRAVRAQHVDQVTVPCAELLVEPARRRVGASSFSWVAQAVESVRTTSLPSSNDSGVQCAATSGADQLGPAAEAPRAPAGRAPSPWSATSRLDRGAEQLRVAVVGVRAAGPRPRAGRRRCRPAARRLRRRRAARDCARASARARSSQVVGRCSGRRPGSAVSAGSSGAGSGGRQSVTASPRRRRRRTGRPASAAGTSAATAAVTSTCSAPATRSASRLAALGVELGEHVVEDQDRVVAVARAAGRTTPAAARARTTTTRRGWRSP